MTKRYCKRCLYDLTGIEPSEGARTICPECGRPFDVSNPKSTRATRIHPFRRIAQGPIGIAFCLAVVVALCYKHQVLPEPVSANSWKLWRWLDWRFGVQELKGRGEEWRLWWWGDVRTINAYLEVADANGNRLNKAWTVRRTAPRQYDVDVLMPGISLGSLQRGLSRVCGDDMLGITFEAVLRRGNAEPFSVSGTKDVVMSEFVRQYVANVRGWKRSDDQTSVWVFDLVKQQLVLMPVMQAELTGYGPIEAIDLSGAIVRYMTPTNAQLPGAGLAPDLLVGPPPEFRSRMR